MEATTTLADALLDDLDDLSDSEETKEDEDIANNVIDPSRMLDRSGIECSTRESPRLLDDVNFLKHVKKIQAIMGDDTPKPLPDSEPSMSLSALMEKGTATASLTESDIDHHQLMVQSNQFLALISTELMNSHHQLCDVYKLKFPELEELIPDVIQYEHVVRCIGNATDITTKSINDALNQYLSSQQIIALSVAFSTTNGRSLSEGELAQVHTIASYMEHLLSLRDLLLKYIEQQMESTVPNMCALIGPTISAQLLSITGGLAALSHIPACNLQVLGQSKHRRGGLISNHLQQPNHTGILAQTDIVQSCPRHLQMKAVKMVAAKLALAIRCDFIQTDVAGQAQRSDASGRLFRQEIEKKIQQLQEPDKAPVLKALPK
jgi:U4/U6 small nuclear ribonucleoprotein PRP31